MNGDHKKDEELIFYSALELTSPTARAAYLKEACGDDAELFERVRALLTVDNLEDGFLEDPPTILDVPMLKETPEETAGTVIGRYKLLEKIGEGGMAVVYMAEQAEPIRRKVALKIIKLGMDTKQVIARFEAERQALAMMDHPNIAKVLDAGATETGRPYFVMELVTGVSVTEYCDQNNLSTKDRLALFLQVCNAVQHAHQKGIIHRDIKPSNVMVAYHDGKPVPKVIDFGIAKATNQRLTEKTLFTRYAHIIGTPAYMSPEQAELSDVDIDTRSDIYSMGVLLYELLTGTTPFSEEELRKAGYVEMQRVIREQEPAKPSTRLSTLGETLMDVAKHRNATPDLLAKAVRGDLDWIVMKSLEKDRAGRYETANGLAEDVRRHLEHEPVLARGPSTTYRLQKFLHRHRVQAGAILAIAAVAVAVGIILSMWNRDRLQLTEAEGFRDRGILSQAHEQYARADRDGALETIKPILASKHVGPEAQLLHAGILVDNRRSDEAAAILENLLDEQPEVTGAAHSLLARILWESASPDAEKLQEIETHRQEAEALLPETAEAYFLRAMTAITVKEQLASLDRALQLDPSHYESRRLRAFTYYASRKYDRLRDETLVMTVLRPRDPLGYSLRAIAWCELGRYPEAIADYDSAIALTSAADSQYGNLIVRRSEVFLRMGDYERVITEAPVGAKDLSPLQYHTFCALTALGQYEKAAALFRQIVSPGHEARRQFQQWCMKYVFDTLEAGRSWHPPDREPPGPAFLAMIEAEETHGSLSARAHRLITDGFSAGWSPDGSRLAFSLGVHGYSGVAIYDPATQETDLLIVPGKDPRWSPDGKYIAFVRDCQMLRLAELAEAERIDQHRPLADEEVWLMKSDGTEPRRLAKGSWPSWGHDSEHLYYVSRTSGHLYSLSLAGRATEPNQVMRCGNCMPSVSPDNQHVAYFEGGSLKIKDLASQTPVAECTVPFLRWGMVAWSPTGNEVCLGDSNPANEKTGLWIYSLPRREFLRILDGQIGSACWSPKGTDLAFFLGVPYREIWAAAIEPNAPAIDTLGPARTLDEHSADMVAFYTRRIEADPQDAYAYSGRAQLGERQEAQADMRRWSALVAGGTFADSQSNIPRQVISLPFDCQLVFSAERPVNTIPMMSVAFGQKGRFKMRHFKVPICVTSLFGLCLLNGLGASSVYAGFTFEAPANLGPAINTSMAEQPWGFSWDGLSFCFGRPLSDGSGAEILVVQRPTTSDSWGNPISLGSEFGNSAEATALMNAIDETLGGYMAGGGTADGLEAYVPTDSLGGYGAYDLYVFKRETTDTGWGPPLNLGETVNTPNYETHGPISPDGLTLYFSSNGHGGYGQSDIFVMTRATRSDPWGEPINLGPLVNSPNWDLNATLSTDGLTLFFGSDRPGGSGDFDIWMTRRASLSDPWGQAVNLGPTVNSPAEEDIPYISPDGSTLCFLSNRDGGYGSYDLWQTQTVPIVDFDGDGAVGSVEIGIMVDFWGTDESLCDIGPMPWGDGVVDVQDLIVLIEHMVADAAEDE